MAVVFLEEFWSSPFGIIIVGLFVGVAAVLLIRGLVKLFKPSPKTFGMPRGVPRAKSLNYPDKGRLYT